MDLFVTLKVTGEQHTGKIKQSMTCTYVGTHTIASGNFNMAGNALKGQALKALNTIKRTFL